MVVIEIPPNPNCEAVELRVFHDLAPPQPITQVRLEREPGKPQWYDVISWPLEERDRPALAQKVDDSGEGVAFLLYGGAAGLRLRPTRPAPGSPQGGRGGQAPWQLGHPEQWGCPFLIVSDTADLRFASPAKNP